MAEQSPGIEIPKSTTEIKTAKPNTTRVISRRTFLKGLGGAAASLSLGGLLTGCRPEIKQSGASQDLGSTVQEILGQDNKREVDFIWSKVDFIKEKNETSLKVRREPMIGLTEDTRDNNVIKWDEIKSVQANKQGPEVAISDVNEFSLDDVEFVDGFDVDTGNGKGGQWAQIIGSLKSGEKVYLYISKSNLTKDNLIARPDGEYKYFRHKNP